MTMITLTLLENMGWVCGKIYKGGTNISMPFDVGWKSAQENAQICTLLPSIKTSEYLSSFLHFL